MDVTVSATAAGHRPIKGGAGLVHFAASSAERKLRGREARENEQLDANKGIIERLIQIKTCFH